MSWLGSPENLKSCFKPRKNNNMRNKFNLKGPQSEFCFKKICSRFLFMNDSESAKGSGYYQHTIPTGEVKISKDIFMNFKKAIIAKISGRLDLAMVAFKKILKKSKINNGIGAECHFQLGEIICYLRPGNSEGIGHMVACRTLEERHFNAVNEIERQCPLAGRVGNNKVGPKILLVLGSNAATVTFANHFMNEWPIAGLIQQYVRYPILPLKFEPKRNDLPFGIGARELKSFRDERILGNQWNALFMDYEVPRIFLGRKEINEEYVLEWVKKIKPDLIVSHGPERLREKFIKLAKYGGINVHWGLSPAYRGMDTVRWPLFHKKPEWIGVTIHKLDENLDTGPIIYQARPELKCGYTFRMIEYSLTMLACKIMPIAVKKVLSENVKLTHQDTTRGMQYMANWWTKKHQDALTPNYIAQQLSAYLNNKKSRDKFVELINPWMPINAK